MNAVLIQTREIVMGAGFFISTDETRQYTFENTNI